MKTVIGQFKVRALRNHTVVVGGGVVGELTFGTKRLRWPNEKPETGHCFGFFSIHLLWYMAATLIGGSNY